MAGALRSSGASDHSTAREEQLTDDLRQAEILAGALRARLPAKIDGRALSETVKIPYHAVLVDIGLSEIVAGRRTITADTDLRLCRFFGLSNGYWLRAQVEHDTEVAARALAGKLRRIKPWVGTAA
jgi:addiction module HigA family antidote